jgi:hypothetical protein
MPKTAVDMVRAVLAHGRLQDSWLTAYEIQARVFEFFGKNYSESAITARIRDLRKARYGGHRIDCRKRRGATASEYQLHVAVPEIPAALSPDLFNRSVQ